MERERISKVALVIAVIMIMCIPLTAFVSETNSSNEVETDLMDHGFTVVDAQGNIVP